MIEEIFEDFWFHCANDLEFTETDKTNAKQVFYAAYMKATSDLGDIIVNNGVGGDEITNYLKEVSAEGHAYLNELTERGGGEHEKAH